MSYGYYGHNLTGPCGCPQDVDGPILHGAGGPCAWGRDQQSMMDAAYAEAYAEQRLEHAQAIIAEALAFIEAHAPDQIRDLKAVLVEYAPALLPPEVTSL